MEKLTTDMRFTVYNVCYKRILIVWILTAFTILLAVLFSGFQVSKIRMRLFSIGTTIQYYYPRALSCSPAV